MEQLYTLSVVERADKILLARKTRKIGQGLLNFYGGKVEPGETIEEAAKRELEKESGLALVQQAKRGIIRFENVGNTAIVHIYKTECGEGEPQDSEEMVEAQWFDRENLPLDQMMSGDKYWLIHYLSNNLFIGTIIYDSSWRANGSSIRIVQSLDV